MNWIAYYLDNVWMRKHMDQIAYGLDIVWIRCIVKNWTEIWLRISENLITITILIIFQRRVKTWTILNIYTTFLKSRRFSGECVLAVTF